MNLTVQCTAGLCLLLQVRVAFLVLHFGNYGLEAATTAAAVSVPGPAVTLGPSEMIYDWDRDHCPDGVEPWQWDVPDMPARMWRRKDGETTLIASSNLGSRANIGPDPDHLSHACGVYYNNTCGNQAFGGGPCADAICCNPAMWADREWIFSPWIFPENDTVVALAHMEFHSQNNSAETMCDTLTASNRGACWFNAITSFISHDGGRNFTRLRPPPHHLVAAQPYKMPSGGPTVGPGGRGPMGYEAPSNIMRSPKDGFYYAAMQTWPFRAQKSSSAWVDGAGKGSWNGSGNCFIRTSSLTDPKSWRGWNGKEWSVSFVDPYNDKPGAFVPEDHVCTPVLNLGYPSIGWSSYYQKYIAVGSKYWDCSDVVFALSDDLVEWSAPIPLYQPVCKPDAAYMEIYPSLIDPASPSPNFDVIGETPYIYLVTFRKNRPSPSGIAPGSVVRSIQRRPLRMTGA